jgi:hypothetical protein
VQNFILSAHNPIFGTQEREEAKLYAAVLVLPSPVLTFNHQQEVLNMRSELQKMLNVYLQDIRKPADEEMRKEKEWLSKHQPIYIMDGDSQMFQDQLQDNVPQVLLWSARGQGLYSEVCETHVSLEMLASYFKSKWPQIIFIFQRYGAHKAAKQIFEQAEKKTVVIWANKEIDVDEILKVVKAADCVYGKSRASNIECWLRGLSRGGCLQHAQVLKEEDFICSRYTSRAAPPSADPSNLVTCRLRQPVTNNLLEGNSAKKEMKLLSSDIGTFRKVVEYLEDCEPAAEDFHSKIYIRSDFGKHSTDVYRSMRIAYQVCIHFLDTRVFRLIMHVHTSETFKHVLDACSKNSFEHKKLLLWLDLSSFELSEQFLDTLSQVSSKQNICILLTNSPGRDKQTDNITQKLTSTKKFRKFQVKLSAKKPVVASSLHQEIRLKFCSTSAPGGFHPEPDHLKHIKACIQDNLPSSGFSNIADIVFDDDGSVLVRICLYDISFLHRLRDSILKHGAESFESNLCQSILKETIMQVDGLTVKVDRTSVAEIFEEGVLCLSELTPHQEERLSICRDSPNRNLHIQAAAGAGKTFIALHIMQELLLRDKEDVVRVLFVASNKAMALFVAKWLFVRIKESEDIEMAFERLDLFFPEDGKFPDGVVYRVEEDTDEDMLKLNCKQRETPSQYNLVICDEAHNIFKDKVLSTGLQPLLSDHVSRLILLSDISQADKSRITYPRGWDFLLVELEEVVRSTRRIMTGAMYYQRVKGESNKTKCLHCVDGLPIPSYLFRMPEDASMENDIFFKLYAERTTNAIKEQVLENFPGLSLDNRLAILVPDEPPDFKDRFLPHLQLALDALVELGPVEVVDAVQATCMIDTYNRGNRRVVQIKKQRIICDTINEFDGLERLIVVMVAMDREGAAVPSDQHTQEVRSRIYRALTRAHMLVCIVNEYVRKGWIEFHTLINYDESKFDNQKEQEQLKLTAATYATSKDADSDQVKPDLENSRSKRLVSAKDLAKAKIESEDINVQEASGSGSSHSHGILAAEQTQPEESTTKEDMSKSTDSAQPSRNWAKHYQQNQFTKKEKPAKKKRFKSSVFKVQMDFEPDESSSTFAFNPFLEAPTKRPESHHVPWTGNQCFKLVAVLFYLFWQTIL